MADKSSSSRKQSKESRTDRGRSPPSSSRQNKDRAEKVKHRTPTPHPAKRSSAQLFGPQPPPPPSAVPASVEPRPRATVGQANEPSVSDPVLLGDDDLWDSQNSPRSPAVSPGPAQVPVLAPPDGSAVMSASLPPVPQQAPVVPAVSSLRSAPPVCTVGPPVFTNPVQQTTYGNFSYVAGPTAGLVGVALRAPLAFPTAWPCPGR